MAYSTHCTCTDQQLHLVGCDCDHTGPAKIVKTFAEIEAEAEQAHLEMLAADEAAEIAYWDAQFAAETAAYAEIADAREDFAEWTLAAAKYQ